jgi:NADH-ubiquinone oxidoreductase chain 6
LSNLYIIIFTFLQDYTDIFLDIFSILSISFAIFVIINKNPIVSVLFLICLFILISGYLILLGMNFIGISYLLVYIGAVSILFLFILMLINIRISEIQTETSNSLPLAIVISISFYLVLYEILPFSFVEINSKEYNDNGIDYQNSTGFSYDNIVYLTSNQ